MDSLKIDIFFTGLFPFLANSSRFLYPGLDSSGKEYLENGFVFAGTYGNCSFMKFYEDITVARTFFTPFIFTFDY